jgi:hypothetical protein
MESAPRKVTAAPAPRENGRVREVFRFGRLALSGVMTSRGSINKIGAPVNGPDGASLYAVVVSLTMVDPAPSPIGR